MSLLKRMILVIIVCVLMCILICFDVISAEDIQDAGNKFNIDNVTREELTSYNLQKGIFLDDYILCVAGARDDASICNKLPPKDAQYCLNKYYRLHDFYYELIIAGRVTLKAIRAGIYNKKMTREQCERWAQAFLSADTTMCQETRDKSKQDECMAVMRQDPSICNNQECQDTVLYIKAAKNRDIKICDKIENKAVEALCRGDISQDEDICKQCNVFKSFINVYYPEQKQGGRR